VPVLWDKRSGRIVSNESYDIIQSFDRGFGSLARPEPTFFPKELEREIEAMTEANYQTVNNGVYRVGFARSQDAYDEAVSDLFVRLEELERLLGERRYLLGAVLTAADWCLFTTLLRFDLVYHYHFKCNVKRLRDYPHLWGYTRELYQHPGVAKTCDFEQIKRHYYTSHESINPTRVIPLGPSIDFDGPHERA
jgi:putative glutathione S-transferase